MKKKLKKKKTTRLTGFGRNSRENSAEDLELSIEGTSFVTLIDGVNHVDIRF